MAFADSKMPVRNTFIQSESTLASRSSRRVQTWHHLDQLADEGSTGSDVDLDVQRLESSGSSREQSDGEGIVDMQLPRSPSSMTINSFEDYACTTDDYFATRPCSPLSSPSQHDTSEHDSPLTDTRNTTDRSIVVGFACAEGRQGLPAPDVHATMQNPMMPMQTTMVCMAVQTVCKPMPMLWMPMLWSAEATKFGFAIGDHVGCTDSDSDVPAGSIGAVVAFLFDKVRVKFPKGTGDFLPEHLTKAWTTLMLRNFPNNYKRHMVLDILDSRGFAGQYDFFYMPIDYERKVGKGYAFVNCISPAMAARMTVSLQGFKDWSGQSKKTCDVCWASPHQGLQKNIEYYQNNAVMHRNIPDEYKPMYFVNGEHRAFPEPTKRIRYPKKDASDAARPRRK